MAVSDVDDAGLAETVDLLKHRGAEVRSDHLDVSDRAAMAAYAGTVADHFGRVNVIVNNDRAKAELFQSKPKARAVNLLATLKGKLTIAAHTAEADQAIASIQAL